MKTYLALSINHPGGDLIRSGEKTLEIRKWRPDSLPLRDLLIVQNLIRLSRAGQSEDPDGQAVALVDIKSVTEWREADLEAACGKHWEPGWLAWKIVNVRPFDYKGPVPAKLRIYQTQVPKN